MVKHFTLTLDGATQRLSDVLPSCDREPSLRVLTLQPDSGNASPIFLGDEGVSDSDYGLRMEAADDDQIPPAPVHFAENLPSQALRLSELYVVGANGEKLRVLAIFYV